VQLLSRALCRFRWVPYGDVPEGQRPAVVRVQLQAWAPFEDSAYAVAMLRDGAMGFAWDQRAFEQRAQAAGLPTRPARVLPETLLLPARTAGLALQRCSVGFEGQFWREGQLVASRWWPQPPDPATWLNFQRSAGVPAEAQQPQPPEPGSAAAPEWLDQPWAEVTTLAAMVERSRVRLHAAAAALLALLLLPTAWLLWSYWNVRQQLAVLEAQRARLEADAQPVLKARTEALAVLAELDALAAAVDRTDALGLLAHVAAQLPADGNRVRDLEWDGRRLRLVLAVPAGTPRIAYVQALEGGGWLKDVREDTQEAAAGTVALTAETRTSRPPATASAAPAASSTPPPSAATPPAPAATPAAAALPAAAGASGARPR
jgi:Tfp pilus assembly protein PilN